jgi:hypothetical protein
MKKKVIATVAATAFAIAALGAPVAAAGKSDVGQLHPGHAGYVNSGGTGGGIPTAHFAAHGGPGYPSDPGGWGGAVSATAKACKGIPSAHNGC